MSLCVLQFVCFFLLIYILLVLWSEKMLDIDFCFLKFAKVCLVAQHVENVSCELEKNVYSSAFNRIFCKCK